MGKPARYRIAAAAASLVVVAGIVAAAVVHFRQASAESPFNANPITVSPEFTPLDDPDPSSGLFKCQVGLSVGACYDPFQMRHAYHVDSLINAGYTGAGHTIVIVDAFQSPYLLTTPDLAHSDLTTFDNFYNLPPSSAFFTQVAPDGLTPFNFSDKNMLGWAGEITLDVEWAHAIAPGANIVLDLAKSNNDTDILSAIKYAVDNNLGDVISQSFGENESCADPALVAAQHQVYEDATRKGITIFASSGDQGAAQQTCDGKSWTQAASFPADDPLVTAVGGTELHAAGYCLTSLGCDHSTAPAPGTYQSEVVWNESISIFPTGADSTGGGYSTIYGEPSYQEGTIPGGKQRALPDVSYNAAVFHGVLVRWGGGWFRFGGTSAGSPQWAAITAIADQKAGHSLGFINKALYHIGQAEPHYSAGFSDVTSGNNSVVELDASNNPVSVQGFDGGPGWDATTGLGSPIADQLVNELIQFVSPGDSTSAAAQS